MTSLSQLFAATPFQLLADVLNSCQTAATVAVAGIGLLGVLARISHPPA